MDDERLLTNIERGHQALEAAIAAEDWAGAHAGNVTLEAELVHLGESLAAAGEVSSDVLDRLTALHAAHRHLTLALVAERDSTAHALATARTGRKAARHYLDTAEADR